ncbi:class I SAM-dependent methyltransferase [Acidobacteria bacterium ACD]|nr:MAG: class I SAM-dependent methyltransferase [Acidobacteriota bacterium]MCE7956321.1 class I SAM-dependent methyltransferase [Acidobacteria bacterium ACB2]MDL1948425.1 class I SAM-dependent methyltransferase [Acidobacteria bacterium ACD]
MLPYTGRHAALYDVIYAEKPYAEEAGFVDRCLRQHGVGSCRRLLELACGTGEHALELARRGYRIVAVDSSPDMIALARAKAAERNLEIDFRVQDMRELSVGDEYDAAYCLFDSIGYVVTNEAVEQVLRRVRSHLRRGGLFVFEFWHAPAMLRHYRPVGVRRWHLGGTELLRIAETKLEVEEQVGTVSYSLYELSSDGRYQVTREEHRNRYFSVPEMSVLLERADLVPVSWLAGFEEERRIEANTWHILCLARRPE